MTSETKAARTKLKDMFRANSVGFTNSDRVMWFAIDGLVAAEVKAERERCAGIVEKAAEADPTSYELTAALVRIRDPRRRAGRRPAK